MNRRILAAVLALGLALVGTVVLVSYVRGADARALAGVHTTRVLVVTESIPQGTPAGRLTGSVRLEEVPAKVAATGSVSNLTDLGDRVTTVALEPGEQLLASRFAERSVARAPGTVDVPKGDQEVSILLEPQRAVGGRVAAGDTVGVYLSLKQPDGTGLTHAVLHSVLVTQVQGAPAPANSGDAQTVSSGKPAPSGNLLVTLAVTAAEAEPIVFGMEHGTVWLSLEPAGSDNAGTAVIGPGNVYTEAYR